MTAAFAVASSTNDEYAPQLALRSGLLKEVTYYRIPVSVDYNFDIYGQSLNGGALSGAAFAVANGSSIREMTPAISCGTTTSCVDVYRWFNSGDFTTDVDRIKARLLSY